MSNIITLGKTVIASDPCYDLGTWCQAKIENVKKGEYAYEVQTSDEGEWGVRNSALFVIHKDYVKRDDLNWIEYDTQMGVDSGQFGIFDADVYNNNEYAKKYINEKNEFGGEDVFYGKMCAMTLSENRYGAFDKGVVTSSGYGDGGYTLHLLKDGGKVVGFGIRFL